MQKIMIFIVALLAVQAEAQTVQSVFDGVTGQFTLEVTGTNGPDTIAVHRQNDFVVIILNGNTVLYKNAANTPLITVDSLGGDDFVYVVVPPRLDQNQNIISMHEIEIDLGDGNDTFETSDHPSFHLGPGNGPPGYLEVNGGEGSDILNIYGAPNQNTVGLTMPISGGSGDDFFTYNTPFVLGNFYGGSGYDITIFTVEDHPVTTHSMELTYNNY